MTPINSYETISEKLFLGFLPRLPNGKRAEERLSFTGTLPSCFSKQSSCERDDYAKEAASLLLNFLPRSFAALTLSSRNVKFLNVQLGFLCLSKSLICSLRPKLNQIMMLLKFFGAHGITVKHSQN